MSKKKKSKDSNEPMFFSAYNYKLISLAIFLIIAGFTAMYLENEIDGFISLFISPIVIMSGYILVIYAIMKHDDQEASSADPAT